MNSLHIFAPVRLWPVYAFHFALWSYLIWGWVRWVKSSNPLTVAGVSRPRLVIAMIGFVAATISVGLDAFLLIHALFTGGFPFFHPVEMLCGSVGGLTAFLGLGAAAFGKGRLRAPAAVCSGIAFALWWVWGITL